MMTKASKRTPHNCGGGMDAVRFTSDGFAYRASRAQRQAVVAISVDPLVFASSIGVHAGAEIAIAVSAAAPTEPTSISATSISTSSQ